MDEVSGRFEWETILRRTICEGNMAKVADLSRNNFKAYHVRGKHGRSGRFERETILRHTICEGNMDKVADLSGKQF